MQRMQKRPPTRRARKTRVLVFLILALLLMAVSLLAPYLAPNDPNATNAAAQNAAPGEAYPLGADRYGRCVLSRVLAGARTSIFSAVALVAVSGIVGSLLGVLCGYYGGVLDSVVMRLADILLAFPQMVLAIAVAGVLMLLFIIQLCAAAMFLMLIAQLIAVSSMTFMMR